ncbi:MAG: Sec-independent protein translocase protein TatB [Motiliproteus sp.]|nr:Sec-independent protein translocase protein TatB [Motiliproteus sp.]MCW9051430.1 Sec-independent protein translocase protein TatB [Motiliproteus sp.]
MFDIGFTELLIVAVVALIVVGPERLPTAVRTVGLWVGRIRRTIGSVQKEISEELRIDEMRKAAKEQQEKLESQVDGIQKPFSESLREEILVPDSKGSASSSGAESDSTQKPADKSADS